MKGQIVNTNIRLNLARDADRKAWEYLQKLDRKTYKSYSRAVILAVNDFFDRLGRSDSDKEEALLQKLREVIHQELQSVSPALGLMQLFQSAPPVPAASFSTDTAEQQEALDVAIDFVDSF